jgi:signal transduction histidine kinase
VLDAVVVIGVAAVIEALVWAGAGPGDRIGGPRLVAALLPLLLAAPLWFRRRAPVLVCALVMSGLVVQVLISGHAAEGLEMIVATGLASYAVAAHSPRRRALIGLGVIVVGYGLWIGWDRNVRSGRASELWAGAFFALYLLAVWLIGTVAQARRESAAAAARSAAVQREAQRAVAEERGRIARDLHDIVAHNLSVVVVQAAGGQARAERASGETAATLQKIETSGREALAEMRRLLGVLRTSDGMLDQAPSLDPTPGVGQLEALAGTVRDAGLPVELSVEVDTLPPAVDVSVYRIVQEALTNVLKHAGHGARAQVSIVATDRTVTVTVLDDGRGPGPDPGLGHGLRGMRERVSMLDGELLAGGRPNGGFAVTARLPATGAA